eukprot:jgi/Ulvmu1/12600/UM092_0030.1
MHVHTSGHPPATCSLHPSYAPSAVSSPIPLQPPATTAAAAHVSQHEMRMHEPAAAPAGVPQAITVTPHAPQHSTAATAAGGAVPLVPQDIVAPQAAVPLSSAVASMHRGALADSSLHKRPRTDGAAPIGPGHFSHSPSPPPGASDGLGMAGETAAIQEREKKRLAQNREAAKRFRQKKKNHMQELEEMVAALRADNAKLRLAAGGGGEAPGGGVGVLHTLVAGTAGGRGTATSSASGGGGNGGDGLRGGSGAVNSSRAAAESDSMPPPMSGAPPLPPTLAAARQWWDDLAALVARPGARTGDAAAVTVELRTALEAYPELLKAALLEGHVLAISNAEHCPAALRAILWHGFLQPSEVQTAATQALPAQHAAHAALYELRAQMETQEAYIEQYTHSAAAELRRMLLEPAARAGLPQYLPFVAILPVAAAQLLCSLVGSMEAVLTPAELRDVMLTWLEATFSFPAAAATPPSEATVQVALSYLAGTATAPAGGGDDAAHAAAAAAAAAVPSAAPDSIAAAAQVDPAYIAHAQAAALAVHYATQAGYASDPAQLASLPASAAPADDSMDPAAAVARHAGLDPATLAAMASAAALAQPGDAAHAAAAAAAAAASWPPADEQAAVAWPPADVQAAAELVAVAVPPGANMYAAAYGAQHHAAEDGVAAEVVAAAAAAATDAAANAAATPPPAADETAADGPLAPP